MANKRIISFLMSFLILVACSFATTNLIPCPDCERPVSIRAVFCPNCGCPGDAIKEAVAQRKNKEEGPPVLPVVRLIADHGQGYAVAVTDNGNRFIVMDAMLLAETESLRLTLANTNTPVDYRTMQLAENAPLIRFQTTSTNLLFLGYSRETEINQDAGLWLMPDGTVTETSSAPALQTGAPAVVDARTNVLGIAVGAEGIAALTPDLAWKDVAPAVFRRQMALLSGAEKALDNGNITPAILTALKETHWASVFLAERAKRILNNIEEEQTP